MYFAPFFFVLLPVIFGTRYKHTHGRLEKTLFECDKTQRANFRFSSYKTTLLKQQLTFRVFQACFRTLAVILVSDLLLLFLLSLSLSLWHVCIWRCEHAMFCVEILMYNVSLTHSCLSVDK